MRRLSRVVCVVVGLLSVGALAAQKAPAKGKPPAPRLVVKVATERADALYKVG